MKRCRCISSHAVVILSLMSVGFSFRANLEVSRIGGTSSTKATTSSGWISCWRHVETAPRRTYHGSGSLSMLARAKTLREEQRQRVKGARPLSAWARKQAKRDRRAYYRRKFACSGYRLIKMQQEDPDSFFIGVVGANLSGRAQALKSISSYLKRATELKVGPYYKPNTRIKLLESGSLRIPHMVGKDEHKLGLLRRCDLLVHVVRCFELQAPSKPREGHGDADQTSMTVSEAGKKLTRQPLQPWGETDVAPEDVEWPLLATPLEDMERTTADMALADLQFIQERARKNHTKFFWRNRQRALNERRAMRLVEPALEDVYAAGGTLVPMGKNFGKGCLRDERMDNGTTIYRNRMRTSIEEIGFLSAKPIVYVANLPAETADTGGDKTERPEEAKSIARVALAHAEAVLSVQRDYGVPAVAACLMSQEGQEALGAKVFKAIPQDVLARDPKVKKASRSAAKKKARQDLPRARLREPSRGPGTMAQHGGQEEGARASTAVTDASQGDVSNVAAEPRPLIV